MLSLRLFGGLVLGGPDGPVTGRATQRRRLAVLAVLAHARGRPVSRDKLVALFWPESDSERARHLLADSVYILRNTLGDDLLLTAGDDISLNPDRASSDVAVFFERLEAGDLAGAVDCYAQGGPFLDGVYLSDAPEFERWVDSTRSQLAEAYRKTLEELARAAARAGDHEGAVGWWRRLAAEDRLSSRVALALMRALVEAGDLAGALDFFRTHERTVRADLEVPPDAAVTAYADELRRAAMETPPSSSHDFVISNSSAGARAKRSPATAVLAVLLLGVVAFGAWRSWHKPVLASVPSARYRTQNIAAWELYLSGINPLLSRSDSGRHVAIDFLRRAIAADSQYAAAWARLSYRYTVLGFEGWDTVPRRTWYRRAEDAARKALALDDSLGEAHLALGFVKMRLLEFATAKQEFTRALALDPANPLVRETLGFYYGSTGQYAQALIEAQRNLRDDRLSTVAHLELAGALLMTNRCAEALAALDSIAAVRPVPRQASTIAARCYMKQRRWPEAIARLSALTPDAPQQALLGYALAQGGRQDDARRILDSLLARWESYRDNPFEIGVVYAGMGDLDQTFTWMDRAVDQLSLRLQVVETTLENVRNDPRWERLRRRVGLH